MNYKTFFKLGAAFMLAAGVFSLVGCKKPQMQQQQSNEYAVRTVTTASPELNYSYPATIRGMQDVEIRPRIAGNIIRVCVEEGATVGAGQTLFVIDDATYREAVNQAQAAVNQAHSGLEQANAGVGQANAQLVQANASLASARLTYNNKQELLKKKIIGDYEFQKAANDLAQAEAAVNTARSGVSAANAAVGAAKSGIESANAALATAKQNLSYCYVKSPSAGVVGSIPFKVGALVSSTMVEPLTTVSNISTMYVYFSITEQQLLEMTRSTGDTRSIIASMPPVSLKLADGSIYEQTGKINTISGIIDQTTGSISMRADFANPRRLLKTGGSGNVLIPYVTKDAILIPQSATVEVQDQKYVYVVGKDNKVAFTVIQVADVNDGESYIVKAGLKAGDRIVSQGVSTLKDGMEIVPITEEQAAAKIQQAIQMGKADLTKGAPAGKGGAKK